MPSCDYNAVDDFNRADEALTASTRWVQDGAANRSASIYSNQISDHQTPNWYYIGNMFVAAKYGGDVQVEMTLTTNSSPQGWTDTRWSLTFKHSTTNSNNGNGYYFNISSADTNQQVWQFYRWDGATRTALGSSTNRYMATGDVLFISALNDASGTMTCYLNGTQLLQTTDSTYKAQVGYSGFRFLRQDSDANTCVYDDFKVGATITEIQRWQTAADDATVGSIAWTTPDNAKTSDDSRTVSTLAVDEQTHYCKLTNHGATAYPTNTSFQGIVVYEECQASATSAITWVDVRMVVSGSLSGDSKNDGTTFALTDADVPTSGLGGTADMWGLSLAAVDINGSGFGVASSAFGAAAAQARLDNTRVRIYSTITAGASFTWQPLTAQDNPQRMRRKFSSYQ